MCITQFNWGKDLCQYSSLLSACNTQRYVYILQETKNISQKFPHFPPKEECVKGPEMPEK